VTIFTPKLPEGFLHLPKGKLAANLAPFMRF